MNLVALTTVPPSLQMAGIQDPKALVFRALERGLIHRALPGLVAKPPKKKNMLTRPGYRRPGPVPL